MDDCRSASELSKQVNVLHAVNWIANSWKEVESSTIAKCFAHCGFSWSDTSEPWNSAESGTLQISVQQLMDTAASHGMEVNMTSEEYSSAEDQILTEDDEIWERSKTAEVQEEDDEEDDDRDVFLMQEDQFPQSTSEALAYLSQLALYFQHTKQEYLPFVDKMIDTVERQSI